MMLKAYASWDQVTLVCTHTVVEEQIIAEGSQRLLWPLAKFAGYWDQIMRLQTGRLLAQQNSDHVRLDKSALHRLMVRQCLPDVRAKVDINDSGTTGLCRGLGV